MNPKCQPRGLMPLGTGNVMAVHYLTTHTLDAVRSPGYFDSMAGALPLHSRLELTITPGQGGPDEHRGPGCIYARAVVVEGPEATADIPAGGAPVRVVILDTCTPSVPRAEAA